TDPREPRGGKGRMTPEQAAELRRPFPPSAVRKLPQGGIQLDYVGHAATTDRLLAVDPDWTWEPVAFDERGLPAFDERKNLWIRLTVCGVTRYGVGDGNSPKECIGDAIRNAAMRFGVALELWSKEELEQPHGPGLHEEPKEAPARPATRIMSRKPKADTGEAPTPDQMKAMHASFNEAGITDRDERLAYTVGVIDRHITSSNQMTRAEVSLVLDELHKKAQA